MSQTSTKLSAIGALCEFQNKKEIFMHVYVSFLLKKGVDVIWETIGGRIFDLLLKHLAIKGRLVVVGSISGYLTESLNHTLPKDLLIKVRFFIIITLPIPLNAVKFLNTITK